MSTPRTVAVRVVLACRADLLTVLNDALRAPGIRVIASCANRVEALDAIRQGSPDVCIVDRELAGGGLIVAAAAASPRPGPKVILVGATDTRTEQRAARLAGAAAYLVRSSDGASFVAAVSQLARKESS